MKRFPAEYLRGLGTAIFTAMGSRPEEAAIVADELVEASLMGLESHGVIRYIFYADEWRAGRLKPGAAVEVVQETQTTAVVDVRLNFGQIGARKMADIAIQKAQASGVSCVVSRHCHHVSRLGSYTQRIAERDLIGLATTCSWKGAHWVAPWGGRAGRLATNPISYAAPTSGRPIVFDMSTSMISEGRIRVLMHQGEELPSGCVRDAEGHPTTDPKAFYGPPLGTILPFGGEMGYKGFGLGLLTMILGEAMAGEDLADDYRYLNGLALMAVNPAAFGDLDEFNKRMDAMAEYMRGTPPAAGHKEVLLPGERDFRTRDERLERGVPLDEETWKQIEEVATSLNVAIRPLAG